MKNCLVIIDVQEGFLTSKETKQIPEKIQKLLEKRHFDHIVGTKFINVEDSPFVKILDWHELTTEEERQVHKTVLNNCERVFEKKIYSCFTEEFMQYLKETKIEKLYFVGVDTDGCVLASAFDSFQKNIPPEVLINYCASGGGEEYHNAAVKVLKRQIGEQNVNTTW